MLLLVMCDTGYSTSTDTCSGIVKYNHMVEYYSKHIGELEKTIYIYSFIRFRCIPNLTYIRLYLLLTTRC